jgi:hypothetical protein
MPGRIPPLALLIAVVAAALPASAAAGEFSRDRAGDVKVRGLAPPQRAALDIIGVDLTKTRFLTRVVVRFKGNFARQVRTPRLRRAGVLIRLSFKDGTARTTVASAGTSPTIGAGAGGPGGTIRNGREVAVWVAGVDGNQLARVDARSFRGGSARGSAWDNAEDGVNALLQLPKADEKAFRPRRPPESLVADCERIRKMARSLERTGPPDVRDVAEAATEYLAQPPCSEVLAP